MPRPIIHNRRLGPSWHRIVNAVFCGAQLAGLGALGVGYFSVESWLRSVSLLAIYLSPAVACALLLFVDPEQFSLVAGAAGELGNDELE